jgi:hypothetical protein
MKRFLAGLVIGIAVGPFVWALVLWTIGPLVIDPDDIQAHYFSAER